MGRDQYISKSRKPRDAFEKWHLKKYGYITRDVSDKKKRHKSDSTARIG